MAKILSTLIPNNNVIINGEQIQFSDGVYETENAEIIAELKKRGFSVENKKQK